MTLNDLIEKYGNIEITDKNLENSLIEMCTCRCSCFIPKMHEDYYYINFYGEVINTSRDIESMTFFLTTPIFKTREECEEYIEICSCFYRNAIIPDWNNDDQQKYYFKQYNYKYEQLVISSSTTSTSSRYMFESISKCNKLIKKFGAKKIAKYILGLNV